MKNSRHICALLSLVVLLSGCFRTTSNGQDEPTSSVLPGNATFRFNSVEDLYNFMTYQEDSYPLVSAHRGGPTEKYPENSLETFEFIAAKMPIIIECDVRLSKDSVPILMHDESVDRTTNGTGNVSDLPYAALRKLKLKDNYGNLTSYAIPTLEEVLKWGKGKVLFTLDVKQGVPYSLVSEAIRKHGAEAFSIIITYNANQALAVYRANADLMISTSIKNGNDLQRLVEKDIPDNRLVAFVGTKQPDHQLVQKLHAHGIKIILGTIGNLDRQAERSGYQAYAEYIINGADILSTDRPEEAHKALDYYIRKRSIRSPYINH